MSITATILQFIQVAILLSISTGKLLHNLPKDGVGHIMLSSDDNHQHYNKRRLMVIFDLDCLGDTEESILSSHTSASSILPNSNQQLKVNSIINNHYPCLSHHRNENFQQYSSGYGMSFLNVDTQDCLESNKDNIKLDYNQHCIHSFSYEPLFYLDQNFGRNYEKLSTNDYTCTPQSTIATDLPNGDAWGLDQTDSFTANNIFQHPDINMDNGVDLYIVDSGVHAAHDEFVNNNVYHMLGDGAATYEAILGTYYGSHGTHVAGTAGGTNYGVSKNLDIYDYRVCDYPIYYTPSSAGDYPCYTSLIFSALYNISLILENNDRRGVINLSLGGFRSFYANMYEYYFGNIINNGGIVVVAAGNSDLDACDFSPAWTTSAITVGAANSSHHKAYFSNWGTCVDTWAPGQQIISAIADCDDCYDSYQGTSMASPHIAGFVANLLWVDPRLTYEEVKYLLKYNTTNITGDECNRFPCLYPIYDCHTIPSKWYPNNQWPPDSAEDDRMIDESISDILPNYDCNVIGSARLDPLNNNEIYYVEYEPADKCISMREDTDTYFSYSYECISDTNVEFTVWDNQNCDGPGEGALLIENGWIDGDLWYYVDCTDDEEREVELVGDFDESDCDLVYRLWYPQSYTIIGTDTLTGGTEYECNYDELDELYYDTARPIGVCEYYINETTGDMYSWMYSCDSNNFYETYYDDTNCNGTVTESYSFEEGCYVFGDGSALHLEILECGNATQIIDREKNKKSNKSEEKSGGTGLLMLVLIIGSSSGLFLALVVVLGYKFLIKKGKEIPILEGQKPNRTAVSAHLEFAAGSTSNRSTTNLATSGHLGETQKNVVAVAEDDDDIPQQRMTPQYGSRPSPRPPPKLGNNNNSNNGPSHLELGGNEPGATREPGQRPAPPPRRVKPPLPTMTAVPSGSINTGNTPDGDGPPPPQLSSTTPGGLPRQGEYQSDVGSLDI